MFSQSSVGNRFFLAGLCLCLTATPCSAQEDSPYRYLSTNFSLSDVDIGKLVNRLGRVGIDLPLALEGDATVRLQIQIPVNGLREPKAYRFDGTISSTRLQVSSLELLNIQLEAVYRDGILNLDPLAFQIPDHRDDGLPPGRFTGTGRMELVPRGELSLDLNLEAAPAPALSELISQPAPLAGGQLSGTVSANVPADDAQEISAWNMNGQLSASEIKAGERVLQKASFDFLLDNGELRVNKLSAKMEGVTLAGTALAKLTDETSYSSDLKLEVSSLAGLLPGIEAIQPVEPLEATARLNGQVTPLTFRAQGQAVIPETKIGPMKVVSGGLDYLANEDRFGIENLELKLYEGTITGSATLPRKGETPASLQVQFPEALDLNSLADDLSGTDLQLAGGIVGDVQAQAPREKIADPAAWDASANLSVQEGTAWGLAIQRAGLQVLVQEGIVSLSETGLTWANSALDVSGKLQLAEPQTFNADVDLSAGDLQDLNQLSGEVKLPLKVGGSLQADGSLKGQIQDFDWQASGDLKSKNLTFDKVVVDEMVAKVAATPEQVALKSFDFTLYDGTLTGAGQYPLSPEAAGNFRFDWEKINLGRLIPLYLETQTPVEGLLSGRAKASLGEEPEQGPREWTVDSDFQIPAITIGVVEAGNLTGQLDYKDQQLDYEILGKLFEGNLEIRGHLPAKASPDPEADKSADAESAQAESAKRKTTRPTLPGQGRLEFENMQLQQVSRLFAGNLDPRNLTGQLSLTFEWSAPGPEKPDGSGSLVLTALSWNGNRISDRLAADVELRGNRLVATSIGGTIAGGQLQAEAVWGLRTAGSRLVNVRLRNLNAKSLAALTPFSNQIGQGRLDIEATILPRELWQVDMRLKASQITLAGVKFQSVALPLRGTILPTLARGDVRFRSLGASFAGGRVSGQASVGWGERRRVKGELKFAKVDTKSLVRQVGGSDLPGDGKLSGTVQLEGSNLRDWSDITAGIDAKLSRSQPRKLPVVEAFESVARTVSLSQPIDEGRIKARYARQNLNINELTLSGPSLELLMKGQIAANKRLNLDVLIKTGRRSIDRRIAHLIGGQLGNRVLGILADRLIHGKVTGTVNRPIVNVKPLSLINIKALR